MSNSQQRDIFICHASEDKPNVVKPLVKAFNEAGISYWYDEAEIKWGDSITEKVNKGLRVSRYVIVVLSEAFLQKRWPQRELNSALNIEASSGQVRVLPLLAGTEETNKRIFREYPILSEEIRWNPISNFPIHVDRGIEAHSPSSKIRRPLGPTLPDTQLAFGEIKIEKPTLLPSEKKQAFRSTSDSASAISAPR